MILATTTVCGGKGLNGQELVHIQLKLSRFKGDLPLWCDKHWAATMQLS